MIKKLPKDIPLFLAILVFSFIIGFALSYMYHEYNYGNPKSTFVIGFIEIPIVASIYGGIAFLLGMLIKKIWLKYSKVEYTSKKKFLVIYILIVIISIFLGIWASVSDVSN